MHFHELFFLSFAVASSLALPKLTGNDPFGLRASLAHIWPRNDNLHDLATNANGSTFLWLPQDDYSGKTFFDGFHFYTDSDPTHGTVEYVNQTYAFQNGLAYVNDDGTVVMKVVPALLAAESKLIELSRVTIQHGFRKGKTDPVYAYSVSLNTTPVFSFSTSTERRGGVVYGPLFGQSEEANGHILQEGVHDNEHNQVTWHTGPANYTGSLVPGGNGSANLNCDGNLPGNAGCGITEWSTASYGPFFDAQGGGVFAMKWDETGIAVYSFYRSAIPKDITSGSPDPANWGLPVAALAPDACDPLTFFVNHSIIFDITFCGDWAGNSYATSGCPGSCTTRLMDPSNFVNASWSINSLKVYKKQLITGTVSPAVALQAPLHWVSYIVVLVLYVAW
ncbi:Glycoside hydrolase family 16 protein [Mycena venus]|uniref:Glycoside hydrolase family 16 protein n=1 Tax=Mycena venus TaxID=2733690 RepID=A0A8H7CN13_9AGAR|nr:Glycoside hydrolase family 16 protein [Mycena venus]